MIVLRRSPMKRAAPPWPRRPERQWGGAMPAPRPIVAARAVSGPARPMCGPVPKEKPLRSEAYRRYCASFPCSACGIEGLSQAAHPNLAAFGKGMARKAGDQFCFPLCSTTPLRVGCHAQFDLAIEMTRDERREKEAGYVARMQAQARKDGRL